MKSNDNNEEEDINEVKEIFKQNNVDITSNNIPKYNNQGISREKALNFIKYGTKALTDGFEPQSIIEEEEEEEEEGKEKGEEGEKKGEENGENEKEEECEDREFRMNPSRKSKHFLRNSKSYVAMRENYNEIQNRVIDLAKKDQERRLAKEKEQNNEDKKENTKGESEPSSDPKTEPVINLEEAIEEQNNYKQQFEEEDKVTESTLPLACDISLKDYQKYHNEISTPLNAITESNERYRQLENSVNQAKGHLDKLIEGEEKNIKKDASTNIDNCHNNPSVNNSKSNLKSESILKSSSAFKLNNRSSISSNHTTLLTPDRNKRSSFLIGDEKILQEDKEKNSSGSKSSVHSGSNKSKHNRKKSGNNNERHQRSSSSSGKKKKRSGSSGSKSRSLRSAGSRSKSSLKSKSKSRTRSLSQSQSRNLTSSPSSFDSNSMLNNDINLVSNDESVIEHEFAELKEQVLNGIGEFEGALTEFVEWKNGIIENNIPSNMKLEVTLLFSRLFRSKNIMMTPLFETLRKIDIYSRKWVNKDRALTKIEEDYLRQDHLINIAIRKMLQLNFQVSQLRSKRSTENWARILDKFFKRNKLLMYKNCQYDVNDFEISDSNSKLNDFDKEREYYEKKINYLKDKLYKYRERFNVGSDSDSDGEKKLKKKKKNKFRSQDEMNNNISEDLFIRILDNEKNKIKSHYALFNRTLKKRRPKLCWDLKRRIAINNVRYKYLIQKSFRALPCLIQNLKDYVTKGFWRGPHLFRNHYISEYNGELYNRSYYKKYTSPDIIPNHNSCTDLQALLKLSTNKVNPNLVRSNSFACGQEFPWINSRSLNETSFKEANKKKRDAMTKELLEDGSQSELFEDINKNIDDYIKDNIERKNKFEKSQANLADLTKDQICDIITILYPDTEDIVKLYNEQQPKFYVCSDDEYDQIEAMDDKAIKDEIKKTTNSTKLLNAIEDSDEESEFEGIDNIDWGNEILQEDIVYDRIKNNIDYSEDYIPWRSETEELYFNPCNPETMSYDKDLKSKVHEYLSNYNSNNVNGLSYKNRFDVKANITHKIKGEEGDIEEGIIGGGLGVDFEGKKGELADYFDPEKTWFSLQDVMELTLLHAQQLETMNEEYNKQIEELNDKLKNSEEQLQIMKTKEDNNTNTVLKESLKKIQELQDTLNKKNKEIKMLQEENVYYREAAMQEQQQVQSTPSAPRPVEHKISFIEKKRIPNRIRKYSFFNRLEAFNTEKIKHRDRLLQEQVEKYLRDFEYRLSHEHRLSKPNPEYEAMLNKWKKTGQKLKAEFMPLEPGLQRPQYYKELKLHGIESPWGGKFHVTQGKSKDDKTVNYLNLFEIAKQMKLRNNSTSNNNL